MKIKNLIGISMEYRGPINRQWPRSIGPYTGRRRRFIVRTADLSAPIRINLTKSPSTSVGARVAGRSGEGLYGRPPSLLLLLFPDDVIGEAEVSRHGRP